MSINETRPHLLHELELMVCLGLGNLRSRVSQYQFALMVLYYEKLGVSLFCGPLGFNELRIMMFLVLFHRYHVFCPTLCLTQKIGKFVNILVFP